MNNTTNTNDWYVLYAKKPLEATQRLRLMMNTYVAAGNKPFDMQLRTPREFVEPDQSVNNSTKIYHDYLYRYVFAKADFNCLYEFMRFCGQFSSDIWPLSHTATDGTRIFATVDSEEIDRFFSFCEAYRMYNRNMKIPFIELTIDNAENNDLAEITQGPYAGQKVLIDKRQTQSDDKTVQVKMTWFQRLGMHITVQKEHLLLLRKAKYNNNKYAVLDEFFDFLEQPEVWQRFIEGRPSTSDIAKALRMKSNAGYDPDAKRHGMRQSLRVRAMNLAALIAVYHIIDDKELLHQHQQYWEALLPIINNTGRNDRLQKIVNATMPV